jgi:hypothetical protein
MDKKPGAVGLERQSSQFTRVSTVFLKAARAKIQLALIVEELRTTGPACREIPQPFRQWDG